MTLHLFQLLHFAGVFVFMYGVSGLRLLEINGRLMSVSPSQNASSQHTSGVLLEVDHTTKAVF
jgi:hypothetical protein